MIQLIQCMKIKQMCVDVSGEMFDSHGMFTVKLRERKAFYSTRLDMFGPHEPVRLGTTLLAVRRKFR